MKNIDTTETVLLDDGHYDITERRGAIVRLRRTADGTCVDMHTAELARRIVGLPPATTRPPRALDTLEPAAHSNTIAWANHVREVLTGENPARLAPDPRYDLSTLQEERVAHKVAELRAAGIACSRATLMRKIREYRNSGTVGLIDGRSLRQQGPLDLLDPRVRDALCDVMADQLLKSTGTKSRLIHGTQSLLLKRYGAGAPAMPAEASMYRYIKALDAGRHTTGSARTRRSLGQRPPAPFTKSVVALPGQEVQVDSNKMDILVQTEEGPQRPTLTTMIDVATRSLLAYTIRMNATKSLDHVALLAQALVPAQNRPDKSEHRAAVQLSNPHIRLIDAEELAKARNARPFLFPRRIHMDNGRDYLGATFLSAAERFGVDITLSSVRTPTGKGIVERMFGSINTLFLQYQPGYVGRSPEFRGEHVEKEDLLDIWALFELFDDWVVTVYQNRPHSGLRDPMNPSVKWAPNQMVHEASLVTSNLVLPLTSLDYIELLPSTHRVITSTGVAVGGREYDSPDLHPLRNQKSGNKSKNYRWEVKTDPYDLHRVWLRRRDGTFIECLTRDASRLMQPFGELLTPREKESERTIVARTNAELTGTPVHLPPPTSGAIPAEWDDDDTIPQFDQFNPHED